MNETFYARTGKRWLDCSLSLLALLVTSPLLLLAALFVRITSKGPALFRQTRIGREGLPFSIVKFRTMAWNPRAGGTSLTASGDRRVTPAGRFLRRTKIDELPQLFNILGGEMSFVGPRPETPEFVATYSPAEKKVLRARPGLTGPAAIAYVREEELLAGKKDTEAFYRKTILPAKIQMDLDYCSSIRFLRDLQLILATAAAVVGQSSLAAQFLGARSRPSAAQSQRSSSEAPAGPGSIRRFNFYSRGMQFVVDAAIFVGALFAAYLIRFETLPSGFNLRQLCLWLPIFILLRLAVHYWRGTYRLIWRFVSLPDAVEIAKSVAIVTGLVSVVRLTLSDTSALQAFLRLPWGIIFLEGSLSLIGCLAARALRRMLYGYQRRARTAQSSSARRRTILYGAGRAGQLLRRELENDPSVEVVGFVDDDRQKIGRVICGTRVLGGGEDLARLSKRFAADEIVISMATATRQTLLKVLSRCREASVPTKIIPSVREILSGRMRISELRETKPEDLLGRQSVEVPGFQEVARAVYRDKRVLVTGAGGSIGRELVRQLVALKPSEIGILDKDENSIYELEQELRLSSPSISLLPVIADVRQQHRLQAIFTRFRPQVVFHAAAHKHVPLMELQPCEAILNNVCGTLNVLQSSRAQGVERFVFISSDKAVNPVNVMGATKRIGELLVQALLGRGDMRSASVRFGNVLGSRGSVLPLFQKQIAAGGPVTITHPDVVRYFMTISEAVHLILCAGTLAADGGIFLLDMGQPRNILQLAHEMITLSGLEPGKDIATTITGLRPGEKLFEELTSASETLRRTRFEKLSLIDTQPMDEHLIHDKVARLVRAAENDDRAQIFEILHRWELVYQPPPVLRSRAAAN